MYLIVHEMYVFQIPWNFLLTIQYFNICFPQTRVLVTHGITWLPKVDKIFVVEDGMISESGTYQQLMDNEGAFAAFVQKYQTDGHVSDDEENTVDGKFAT